MKLKDLLKYDDIVIQCHDELDADTIASGFALLKYLEKNGKTPQLVYTGRQKVITGSLDLMVKDFDIPLTYLPELDREAELLVTVDCRASQGNVSVLRHKKVAVIDHHPLEAAEKLPELYEVRTDKEGYGSCATVMWALLKEEGFYVEEDRILSTALYYGLYMDTQELKTAQKMDRDMLEELQYDRDAVIRLQSVNLSLEEIRIAGRAYSSLHINEEHRFAVAQVDPCDPKILGVVSDELMKVGEVDVCAAYCMLGEDQGAKVSVRCRRKGINANDLVHWLVRSMGNDGGGEQTKAAGRLPRAFLEEACAHDNWDDLSGATGRLIYRCLTDYFEIPPKRLETGQYQPDKAKDFCFGEAALYRKKKVPVGYVKATDLFEEGEEILIRMLEGDTIQKVTPELYIMIGVDNETYPTEESELRKNYDLLDEPYLIKSRGPWLPKVYRAATREARMLAPYARKCIAKDGALIWAGQLNCRLEVLPLWNDWHLGEPGDWLASRDDNRQDIYIIKEVIFDRTYEKVE